MTQRSGIETRDPSERGYINIGAGYINIRAGYINIVMMEKAKLDYKNMYIRSSQRTSLKSF